MPLHNLNFSFGFIFHDSRNCSIEYSLLKRLCSLGNPIRLLVVMQIEMVALMVKRLYYWKYRLIQETTNRRSRITKINLGIFGLVCKIAFYFIFFIFYHIGLHQPDLRGYLTLTVFYGRFGTATSMELSTGPGMHKIRVQHIAEVLMTYEPVLSTIFFCDNSPYWSVEQEGEQWDPNLK